VSRTRIEIDLNVRVRGGQAFAGYEDTDGAVAAGDAVVTEVDRERRLIFLAVDWQSLREES
jgi:hypothetical protein